MTDSDDAEEAQPAGEEEPEDKDPFGTRSISDEIVTRLENDPDNWWYQEELLTSVTEELDVPRVVVEESLDHLLAYGDVYRVPAKEDHKIHRTPPVR